MFSNCALVEKLIKKQIKEATMKSFPLRGERLMRDIVRALQMRVGDEVAIPLILRDGANLEPANRVIQKTGRLIQLNIALFHSLVDFSKDMETVGKDEKKVKEKKGEKEEKVLVESKETVVNEELV